MNKKTENTIHPKGTVVSVTIKGEEMECTIAGYKKGWYEDTEGLKFRANQIEEVLDEDFESNFRGSVLKKRAAEVYINSTCFSGKPSKHTTDELANLLAGAHPDAVVQAAETLCEVDLVALYANLNHGQRRMNAGNRIRGALNREEITMADVKKALK